MKKLAIAILVLSGALQIGISEPTLAIAELPTGEISQFGSCSISFHSPDASTCYSACYQQGCGIDHFDPLTCKCYCGERF